MDICIVIPAYNAEKRIEAVIKEVKGSGYPIVVVNDGSEDKTSNIATSLGIEVLNHKENCGKGAALKTGFNWALRNSFKGIITLDADGQHDPAAIPLLINSAETGNYGIVLASRYEQFCKMAGLRKYWNRFGAWCIRKRTGFNIDDSQTGFRYYSAEVLNSVKLDRNGYDMEMEILVKAWKKGFSIYSLPVASRIADGRETSHFRPVRDTWSICKTFLRYM
ncbi:MAG: glycosyltransferase family 2 protein [Desulfuromonadales bacterium]|nr:glycosyltransferase family 2 protein [Desulfuromonadales bacterium]